MDNVIRVSVSEASRLFGVEPKTIRRALKSQQLKYIVVQGRYKINFNSLLEWSQGRTSIKNKLANRGIGQYVDKWKIKNKLFSPNPELIHRGEKKP
ncbi:MAG: hypothetical protein A3J65_01200 [Candidatus Buchananbacteria bacterium RIFCSPHIGHO2_02_FULL_45_11b]|uniref:Helix-turn-helix domain-containing protein n=2 Tax=Candidatus Buchananiibacteriota TaxID=1817903 RepID=A0A1G1YGK2_9BACT|nr:MAG: hypothetical protein A3J65_01200 [Candidatus Buchananbacteria bacterium RIFCSPHIGHO2_02_FULL_45_11b]OGY58045.1 MAG: hypothetical protein A3H67_01080 [Candidatus Buchananbacteria bacterium RIFCSPLOWO2_02_FULL_46_11b]